MSRSSYSIKLLANLKGTANRLKTSLGGLTETVSGLLQTNSVRRSYSLSNNIFLCKLNFHCCLLSAAFASYTTQFHAAFTAALRFRSALRFVLPSRSDSFRLATQYPACKCFANLFLSATPPFRWCPYVFNVLQPKLFLLFFSIGNRTAPFGDSPSECTLYENHCQPCVLPVSAAFCD